MNTLLYEYNDFTIFKRKNDNLKHKANLERIKFRKSKFNFEEIITPKKLKNSENSFADIGKRTRILKENGIIFNRIAFLKSSNAYDENPLIIELENLKKRQSHLKQLNERKMMKDNQEIYQRLLYKEPFINVKEMDRNFEEIKKLLVKLSKVKKGFFNKGKHNHSSKNNESAINTSPSVSELPSILKTFASVDNTTLSHHNQSQSLSQFLKYDPEKDQQGKNNQKNFISSINNLYKSPNLKELKHNQTFKAHSGNNKNIKIKEKTKVTKIKIKQDSETNIHEQEKEETERKPGENNDSNVDKLKGEV